MVRNLIAFGMLVVTPLVAVVGSPGRHWQPPHWCLDVTDPQAVVGRLCEPPEDRDEASRFVIGDTGAVDDRATLCNPKGCSITCADGTSCSASAPAGKYAVCTCSAYSAFCRTATCGT